MIRQTITKEGFSALTPHQKCKLIQLMLPSLKGKDAFIFQRAYLTIGVLQGLLLDVGYNLYMIHDNSCEGMKYNVMVYTFLNGEVHVDQWTNEPIDVFLEAVLTLVIE